MNFTKKTFYGIGIVSAALNIIGGVLLIFGMRASLLFNIATIAAGVMMILLATVQDTPKQDRNICLAATFLTVIGLMQGVIGAVCAAASWPVFAWQYFRSAEHESLLRKIASLVMVCGAVILVGSFLPMPQMLAACIIVAVAVAQGMLVWLLFQQEAAKSE